MASLKRRLTFLLLVIAFVVGVRASTKALLAQVQRFKPGSQAVPGSTPPAASAQKTAPAATQPKSNPPAATQPKSIPPAANPATTAAKPINAPLPAVPDVDPLLAQVEKAILFTSKRYLNADEHTPWQIMHMVLALREDGKLRRHGKKINAIEFISDGPAFRGEPWFQGTAFGGREHPFNVPYAFQGHVNQFMAILTMANLPLDHRFKVDDGRKSVTMQDMLNHTKMVVNDNEEVAWTIWFLTHYIEPDATWTTQLGEPWSMERLVRKQMNEPHEQAPCGGTHGLFALSYNRNAYLQKYGQLRGTWLESNQRIEQFIEATRRMQNGDGSLSSEFYRGPSVCPVVFNRSSRSLPTPGPR